MKRSVTIPEQRLRVGAPAPLCVQVVASAGRVIEDRSDGYRLVEFRTRVLGRELVTVELVRVEPPARIVYRWVRGPLLEVAETIDAVPISETVCELRYLGSFSTPHAGILGHIEGLMIRALFVRAVRAHLTDAKRVAEARGRRSHLFPRSAA